MNDSQQTVAADPAVQNLVTQAEVAAASAPAEADGKAKGKKGAPGSKPKKEKNDGPFSQFSWVKSISVSNAPIRACVFDAAKECLDANTIDRLATQSLIESNEIGVTGRKDSKSSSSEEDKVTFAQGRYPFLPEGTDAVLISFDLKTFNSTTQPQSAKIETWEKLREASGAILQGQEMSIHEALTARASDVMALVAEQVCSGSWAWRNRSESTEHMILVVGENGQVVSSPDDLGRAMYDAFSKKRPSLWKVYGLFKLGAGNSIPAFPSQLLKTSGSDQEKKTAEFYRIPSSDGQGDFALRAVKVGNRLKAIDTWYANYRALRQAIPIEPMGYAHNLRASLRRAGETAADILTRLVQAKSAKDKTLTHEEAMYLAGITIFGGLLTAEKSEGDKAESAEQAGQ